MSRSRMVSVTARCAALSFLFLTLVGHASEARAQAAVWTAPERAAHRPNPVVATTAVIGQGQMVFQGTCQQCHGAKGHGDGPMSTSLPIKPADLASAKVQAQTDGAIFWKIESGKGMMPSTQTTLNDDQRWAVIGYIRTLAAKK